MSRLKVFVSWSGSRSLHVAAALCELLPEVIADVAPWISAHNIDAGARWASELMNRLESSHFGIICLTPENLNTPWLLFEAGSLAKSVAVARVVPYLIGVSPEDVKFPLAQFQGVEANREGTRKLVDALNANLEEPMDAARLERMFQRWWPDFEQRLAQAPAASSAPPTVRSDRELLTEILALLRAQTGGLSSLGVQPVSTERGGWLSLYKITPADLREMTDEALQSFIDTVRAAWHRTATKAAEQTLEGIEADAVAEQQRRTAGTGLPG